MNNHCRNCINYPGKGEVCPKSLKRLDFRANKSCGLFEYAPVRYDTVEVISPGDTLFPDTKMVEFVKIDPQGNVEVLDRKPKGSNEGITLVMEAMRLKEESGENCPYSYRYV